MRCVTRTEFSKACVDVLTNAGQKGDKPTWVGGPGYNAAFVSAEHYRTATPEVVGGAAILLVHFTLRNTAPLAL